MERCENRSQREGRCVISQTDPQPPGATEGNKLHAANGILNLLKYMSRLCEEFSAR